MAFVIYSLVLLITFGSVMFGLDWASAPMSPMPASKYELHAAKPPPPPPSVTAETKPEPAPVKAVSKPEPPPAQTTAAPAPPAPITVPEPVAAVPPPAPKCDVDACAAAYRSFTPEDCTYQPFDGPRRLCEKGSPPAAAQITPPATLQGTPNARAQATCNVSACSQAYISFSATDCTYQPLEGPRRLCEK